MTFDVLKFVRSRVVRLPAPLNMQYMLVTWLVLRYSKPVMSVRLGIR